MLTGGILPKCQAFLRTFLVVGAVLFAVVSSPAAVRQVPQTYLNVIAAYTAAEPGDVIELQPNLYLEIPPVLFDSGKAVTFRPASGRAIVTATNGPPNDTFTGRVVLSGTTVTTTAYNYSAAIAPEQGDQLPRSANGNSSAFGRSVWFEWTAPAAGLVIVNTVGSDFSTLLEVFKGDSKTYLPPEESVWFTFNEIGFNAQAGVTYEILVGGQNRAYGQIALNITTATPPPNDNFAAAHALVGAVTQVQGATFAATNEPPGEPNHAGTAAGHSVWFKWTAPAGDALFPCPVKISSAGSDFDSVLAVYQGASLSSLTVETNNDDRTLSELESEVGFTPVPGTTYFVAIDGSSKAPRTRDQLGNYLLRVDYSLVDLAVLLPVRRSPPVAQQVSFQADVSVRDWGLAPTGPLRIRLAARSGRDFAGIHRAPAAGETTLGSFSVPGSPGLIPGQNRLVTVFGVVPAPVVNNSITNLWGVFGVLEEFFASEWIPIDRAFLLYGYVPESGKPILSYGVGRPVPPAVANNETNQVFATGVRASNFVTDDSTNSFSVIAFLDVGGERTVTNTSWLGPAWVSLTTNGVLHLGSLSRSTNFTVSGRYNFDGRWRTNTDLVPAYKRPQLALWPAPARDVFNYVVQSDFSATYTLEFKDDARAGGWLTNSVRSINTFPNTNTLVGTNLNRRFYRLNARP